MSMNKEIPESELDLLSHLHDCQTNDWPITLEGLQDLFHNELSKEVILTTLQGFRISQQQNNTNTARPEYIPKNPKITHPTSYILNLFRKNENRRPTGPGTFSSKQY